MMSKSKIVYFDTDFQVQREKIDNISACKGNKSNVPLYYMQQETYTTMYAIHL
jgi:hypothetical protein